MNKQEAAKLLAMVKVAYPTAYRDMDADMIAATVNMWQMSFPHTPYVVMEIAFDNFRRTNKYPPTIAEMNTKLEELCFCAWQNRNIARTYGDTIAERRWQYVMDNAKTTPTVEEHWHLVSARIDGALLGEGNNVQR